MINMMMALVGKNEQHARTGNLSRDGNSKSQKETLEIKTTMKNWVPLMVHQKTVAHGQGKTQLEDTSVKTSQPKYKEKKEWKRKRISNNCGTIPKDLTFVY